ncbi:sialate O-acetylesterase, partial [Candidatus Sumerlaeota bacterium]|nr:sialate O-acetylesterase [Candidatus Sumerlaeota bacterium]
MVKRSVVIGAGVLALFALASIRASADVKLPNLISSKMVLQRDVPVTIWGWADEGERVTVSIAGQTHATTAENGKWAVTLAPMKAGGPEIMTISGKNTITLKDILIGEVWVCSGQSNMQWALSQTDEAEKHIAAATNPKIRLYYVARTRSDSPLSETSGTWELCTPKTVPGFSAVAYFFGRELQKAIKAPVGVIHSSWGGSPAEAWTKESVLAANPQFKANILDSYERSIEQFKKALAQEKAKAAKAKKGQKAAAPPRAPWKPGELYNGMIAPLLPYAIKGAIWYQGESNAARAAEYRKLMPTMIQNWRQDWGLGDFPFLIVQ